MEIILIKGVGSLAPPPSHLYRYSDKYLLSCACPWVINTGLSAVCTATGCDYCLLNHACIRFHVGEESASKGKFSLISPRASYLLPTLLKLSPSPLLNYATDTYCLYAATAITLNYIFFKAHEKCMRNTEKIGLNARYTRRVLSLNVPIRSFSIIRGCIEIPSLYCKRDPWL